jgi:hypothetical protein
VSLWHREPRAVYRVYDEDHYLSASDTQTGERARPEHLLGPDAHDSDQAGTGRESHAQESGFGQIDPGYTDHSGVSPATHGGDSRDVFSARPRRGRQGRVVALTVLCVVAASAAALVAFEVSHRSGSAPSGGRRAPARPPGAVASSSNVPVSKRSTSSESGSSAFSSPLPRRGTAMAPTEHSRPAGVAAVPTRPVGASALLAVHPAPLAAITERYVGESSAAPSAQVNREFGFER